MEWVFGLLLFASVPLICRASVDCSGVDGFFSPPEGMSSYVTFEYMADPGTGNICESVEQNCFATVQNNNLRQRTWFLGNTERSGGFYYKPNWIQNYNIVCPPETVLHLYPQFLDTESDTNGACEGFDSIVVTVPGEFVEELCGGETARTRSMLYNEGLGMIFTGGNATLEFCSNGNDVANAGFVIRAMCIDPTFTLLPNCVDFNQVAGTRLGAEFINRIFDKPYKPPDKANILHKRSADLTDLSRRDARTLKLMMSGKRQKRFVNEFITIELEADHMVLYENAMLIVDFNNGSRAGPFEVKWLITVSDTLGTRVFDIDLPPELKLQGPGKVEVFGGLAIVRYTINDEMLPGLLIRNQEITEAINCISNYTYVHYIDPYPVVCPTGADINTFPLPSADIPDKMNRYRDINSLDFIKEDIQNGTCERRVRIELAPASNARMEANILDFCRFFYYSCNAMLRAACSDALAID